MKRQVFFIQLSFRMFVFCFEKLSFSLHVLLVMLFPHVGKCSNSRSQMFFKTGVLENFAIFTGKHLCQSLFLIKLRGRSPAFSLKKQMFYRIPVHFIFLKIYVMTDIRYLKVIFDCCKIRPHNRENFTVDRSEFLVKRCFFLNQDFNSPLRIFSAI